MYKALVLINDGEATRTTNATVMKVELQDENLGRLTQRVRRHLELVEMEEQESKAGAPARLPRVRDEPFE